MVNNNVSAEVECHKEEIMSEVVENASPYLYPCTIEYSLIAAGEALVMARFDFSEALPVQRCLVHLDAVSSWTDDLCQVFVLLYVEESGSEFR